jgi:hypothetical protein
MNFITPAISWPMKYQTKQKYFKHLLLLNCWVLHPVARVSTNAFLKTTVRNNVFVLDFIVHYLLYVSAPVGGHLQVICTQNIY